MIHTRTINGVEITVYDFTPADDQWKKFLVYARKKVPPEFKSRINTIYVEAQHIEHGILFHLSCDVLIPVGSYIPDTEIDALKGD